MAWRGGARQGTAGFIGALSFGSSAAWRSELHRPRGARGTRLRDARRRVRREFGPSATPTLAIGGGTGVHPRERSCVRPIYIWGAAASLEPGGGDSGGDCCAGRGRTVRPPPRRGPRGRAGSIDAWLDAPRGGNDLGRSAVRRIHRPRTGHVLVAAPAGYFAAFFLRSAQEAVIRSETAFFSSAVIGRRFLVGLASDAVSATGGGRSRRPPRGGAPSRGLRRSGGHEHLVDVVQRLDLPLQALESRPRQRKRTLP